MKAPSCVQRPNDVSSGCEVSLHHGLLCNVVKNTFGSSSVKALESLPELECLFPTPTEKKTRLAAIENECRTNLVFPTNKLLCESEIDHNCDVSVVDTSLTSSERTPIPQTYWDHLFEMAYIAAESIDTE